MTVITKPLPCRDMLHALLRYDPKTGHLFYRERGARRQLDRPVGAITTLGYWQLKINGVFYQAHRLIYHMFVGEIPEGYYVDHINADKGDNRLDIHNLDDPTRTNLRAATPSQNAQNRDLSGMREFTAQLRGVTRRSSGKFSASISCDTKLNRIGIFDTSYEAAMAYRQTAKRMHGQFANFT